jgi:hypothetical protein
MLLCAVVTQALAGISNPFWVGTICNANGGTPTHRSIGVCALHFFMWVPHTLSFYAGGGKGDHPLALCCVER